MNVKIIHTDGTDVKALSKIWPWHKEFGLGLKRLALFNISDKKLYVKYLVVQFLTTSSDLTSKEPPLVIYDLFSQD